jgi:hypothetical protein
MNETDRTLNVTERAQSARSTRSARDYFWFALIVMCVLLYLAAHTSDVGISG